MRSLFILTVLIVAQGCGGGGGVERHDVSGSATFNGQPIVFGEVQFFPKHGDDTAAPTGSATIRNGTYTTADGGQGIIGGPHEVRVTAYSAEPQSSEDETVEVEPVEPLFVGYAMEAEVNPPNFDVTVPEDAAGFNYLETKKQRSNEP